MGNDTATAALDTDAADLLAASIEHLTGSDTDAVIAALLPALTGIVEARCATDRAVVLAQVAAFKAKVQRSMVRVQKDTEKHADTLIAAL